jgi:hypothetical protein
LTWETALFFDLISRGHDARHERGGGLYEPNYPSRAHLRLENNPYRICGTFGSLTDICHMNL